ncbi:Short-chain dehydrogenase/reductase SDR [Mycena venus]|uniref:Short-chain dehydrogenase/reductase SDR n=1 Tax=Mycena venus TaxID=2733690 RepID=A0A8H6XFB9_9AGAR|nr:Short-chain dehydrogenase/reductase SDR [Mycena venus]
MLSNFYLSYPGFYESHILLNGTPDEATGAMLLLASPLASYVSGHTLEVTGGADDSQKIVNATVQKYGKINHIVNNDAPGL